MQGSENRIDGKIALVTGATSGIGRVTAQALAQSGATVLIVGRDADRTRQTARELGEGLAPNTIQPLVADLSSQAEVRRLAAEIQACTQRLDILINNAGAVFARRRVSADGIEMTLALNHLAPFLLTTLLLDNLRASPQARIIAVASMAHGGARIPFDDINHTRGRWRSFQVYGQTKLMNIMFTYALARRLADTRATANALHPGFVASHFGKNNGVLWTVMFTLGQPFAISTERGAQTSIYLATAPEVAQVSGKYFSHSALSSSSSVSYDQEAQERLWRISAEMTGGDSA